MSRHGALARLLPAFTSLCLSPWFASGCGVGADEAGPPALRSAPTPVQAGPLRIVGGDTVLLQAPAEPARPQGQALSLSGHHVLFLNFEGTDVRPGGSDSMEHFGIRMTSDMGIISLDPFQKSGTQRYPAMLQVQKLVAGFYADFNVDVVLTRPLSGDYMMTIVGGAAGDLGFPAGVAGISTGDCHNQNEDDLDYAFSASVGDQVQTAAFDAAHESGHAYGLGHTADPTDIMFPSLTGMETGFTGGVVTDPGPCNLRPMVDRQDSHQVLLDNLGPREPGLQRPGRSAPKVKFLSPPDLADAPDGSPAGADLTLAVTASAPLGLDHVTVTVSKSDGKIARGGHPVAELRPPASSARVRLSEAGEYWLLAAAYDVAGNVTLARSKVQVATPTCGVPNDCTPGQQCQNNTCLTPAAPAPADPAATGGGRPYGTTCAQSSECASDSTGPGGICVITSVGQICTHYCSQGKLCAGFLDCVDGICLPAQVMRTTPKTGQLGGSCRSSADCYLGNECIDGTGGQKYCTRVCDPGLAWSCPAEMSCQMTDAMSGQKNRCVLGAPATSASPGGCALSGHPGGERARAAVPGIALLWVIGLALRRGRRERAGAPKAS